jgi:hypothetical protein
MRTTGQLMKRFAGLLLVFYLLAGSWKPRAAQEESATSSELRPWRPTHETAILSYVGAAVCAECHAAIFQSQSTAPMAAALEAASNGVILQAHPRLAFQSGRFSYLIARQGKENIYSVTDGSQSISAPVLWSFGHGLSAQTYLLQLNGEYYESRLSFYTAIEGLDYTLGYPREPASSLIEALGRKLEPDETRKCIACHATGAVTGNRVHLDRLEAGVRCEACHGPGKGHVTAMKAGQSERQIFNPRRLSPDELSQEFCGTCHRSVEDVLKLPNRGDIHNVRFQPYRIFNSRCYSDDPRIGCTACHDPHVMLRHEVTYYDQKCLACHLEQGATPGGNEAPNISGLKPYAPPCPVKRKGCTDCHMPKFALPGSHFNFTDHRIRITKPGMPFPI